MVNEFTICQTHNKLAPTSGRRKTPNHSTRTCSSCTVDECKKPELVTTELVYSPEKDEFAGIHHVSFTTAVHVPTSIRWNHMDSFTSRYSCQSSMEWPAREIPTPNPFKADFFSRVKEPQKEQRARFTGPQKSRWVISSDCWGTGQCLIHMTGITKSAVRCLLLTASKSSSQKRSEGFTRANRNWIFLPQTTFLLYGSIFVLTSNVIFFFLTWTLAFNFSLFWEFSNLSSFSPFLARNDTISFFLPGQQNLFQYRKLIDEKDTEVPLCSSLVPEFQIYLLSSESVAKRRVRSLGMKPCPQSLGRAEWRKKNCVKFVNKAAATGGWPASNLAKLNCLVVTDGPPKTKWQQISFVQRGGVKIRKSGGKQEGGHSADGAQLVLWACRIWPVGLSFFTGGRKGGRRCFIVDRRMDWDRKCMEIF